MSPPLPHTIHATAVLVGGRAVLIRGPSGSGKSRLALALLQAEKTSSFGFIRLVADDRVLLEPASGRLLARPAPQLAGLIEVRGLGPRQMPYEPVAVVGYVLDLAATDASRLPEESSRHVQIAGISLPRAAVVAGIDPFPLLNIHLQTDMR
jgi:HPr kinase/phosphorylase